MRWKMSAWFFRRLEQLHGEIKTHLFVYLFFNIRTQKWASSPLFRILVDCGAFEER